MTHHITALAHWLHSFEEFAAHLLRSPDGIMTQRLLLSLVLCGAIGLERSTHERASGLRTHILVGLGSCLMTLAGGYGFAEFKHGPGADPMRVASYVVSGIGFLGAGAILRHGTAILGMTTAASLWSAAGIGIAVGVGLPFLASVTAMLILFTLVPLQRWESRMRIGADTRDLAIHLRNDREAVGKALAALRRMNVAIRHASVTPGSGDTAVLHIDLSRALKPDNVSLVVQRLLALKYVSRVETADLDLNDEASGADALNIVHYDDQDEETPVAVNLRESREGPRRRSRTFDQR